MIRHRYSRRAEQDLDDILDYFIGKRIPDVGRSLLDAVEATSKRMASQPFIGTPCDDLRTGLRCASAGSYLVYFFPRDDGIEVVRVLYKTRDVQPDMFPEESE
jgi:toxin ParE1/3/4